MGMKKMATSEYTVMIILAWKGDISNWLSIKGSTGISIEFPSVITSGMDEMDNIAHF
jgi:hypothetical protein